MPSRLDLHERLSRRTQLGGQPGLELVPVGIVFFLFGLGELGWHLGPWFLPTLGATAVAAVVATVAAVRWRARRYGRVTLRWDHRITVLVVVVGAAHIAISATDVAPTGPLYLTGVTLGLVLAAMSLWSPYALAQHLVFGLLLAVASAIPLGAWIDLSVPPFRGDELAGQPHPVAVLQPLIVPSWLLVTGIVGHLRLARAFARPVLDEVDTEPGEAG